MNKTFLLTLLSPFFFLTPFDLLANSSDDLTEIELNKSKLISANQTVLKVENGNKILIPNLKGIVLLSEDAHVSKQDIESAKGNVEALNIQVPGSIKVLSKLIKNEFLGKSLTKQDLLSLKQKIIQFYSRSGRPVITLEIPQQKITEGVLQITVIEGKLGKIKVEGNNYFKEKTLKNYIRLKPEEPIDSNILLTDIEWINRNPFRQVDVIYGPGEINGTTDIRLLTHDHRPWRTFIGLDNSGYDETENIRLFTGLNWGNVFGLDHILSLQFTCAPDIDRFWSGTGSYTIPLPSRDILLFFGGYSQVHPHLETPDLDNTGYSAQFSGRYNFILKPHNNYLHELIFGLDYKISNNNLDFGGTSIYNQTINLTQLVFGYNGAYEGNWIQFSSSLEMFYSPIIWLPNQSLEDYRQVRYLGNPHYFYTRLSFSPKIKLPRDFSFATNFRAQISNQNLITSEQFGLGGINTIRGYKERQVNSDNAFMLSTELQTPFLSFIGKNAFKDYLQFLFFLDYGLGWNVHSDPGGHKTEYLLSAGPGIRYNIGSFVSFRGDFGLQLHKLDSKGFCFHFALVASY